MSIEVIFFRAYYSFVGTTGVLLNAALLYLSVFRSPPQIRLYRVLIINVALTDMGASFFLMLISPRIIPLDYALAHLFYGVCQYAGKFSCYVAYSFTLHLFMHSMWLLLVSFCYRHYILISGPPSPLKIFLCVVCVYTPSFIQFIVFLSTAGNSLEIMSLIRAKFPSYEIDYETVTGILNVFSPGVLFTIVNMSLPIFPMYTAILVFRRKILRKLGSNVDHLRSETRSIHQQLLKALTMQACLPVLYTCGCTVFFVLEAEIISSPILEFMVFAIPAPIPLLSCIISIYHIRPYRQALLQCFTCANLKSSTQIELPSSAVALAPNHKVSVLSFTRLRMLSFPNAA